MYSVAIADLVSDWQSQLSTYERGLRVASSHFPFGVCSSSLCVCARSCGISLHARTPSAIISFHSMVLEQSHTKLHSLLRVYAIFLPRTDLHKDKPINSILFHFLNLFCKTNTSECFCVQSIDCVVWEQQTVCIPFYSLRAALRVADCQIALATRSCCKFRSINSTIATLAIAGAGKKRLSESLLCGWAPSWCPHHRLMGMGPGGGRPAVPPLLPPLPECR